MYRISFKLIRSLRIYHNTNASCTRLFTFISLDENVATKLFFPINVIKCKEDVKVLVVFQLT